MKYTYTDTITLDILGAYVDYKLECDCTYFPAADGIDPLLPEETSDIIVHSCRANIGRNDAMVYIPLSYEQIQTIKTEANINADIAYNEGDLV